MSQEEYKQPEPTDIQMSLDEALEVERTLQDAHTIWGRPEWFQFVRSLKVQHAARIAAAVKEGIDPRDSPDVNIVLGKLAVAETQLKLHTVAIAPIEY